MTLNDKYGCAKDFCTVYIETLVSVHFVTELYDKIVNFDSWQVVIQKNTQFGEWVLYLVIALLTIGAHCFYLIHIYTPLHFAFAVSSTNYHHV